VDLDFLKAEHQALADLREQLLEKIDTVAGSEAGAILTIRARLNRVLAGHLAKEDRFIYPRLLSSCDPDAADLASRFHNEMGDLGLAWTELMAAWPDERISSDPEAFGAAIRPALAALARRIDCEEQQLYPAFLRMMGRETPVDSAQP
jgi:hypothetical protein